MTGLGIISNEIKCTFRDVSWQIGSLLEILSLKKDHTLRMY